MSIKKIAEMAGTSPATVSRILNHPEYRCSIPGLRDKVWDAAIALNYVPNEAARNLKKGVPAGGEKTYYINVLMTRMDDSQADPFFTELLHIVESEIHRHMCILSKVWFMSVFSDSDQCRNEDLERIIENMHSETAERCDGMIIIGKCSRQALRKFKTRYKGVVSVNRNSTGYEVDEVLCDGAKIASIAIEHLVQLGHRKIGYVGGCRHEARYRGYLSTLQKHQIALNPSYVRETKQTEAEGFEVMEQFLQSEDYPTGIYCANDITAIGMLKCLNKYKSWQKSPSVISSDDIEQAQYIKPMLTTVRLPRDEMGKFAVYLLLDRLQGGHKSAVRMELEGKLMLRNSCSALQDVNGY